MMERIRKKIASGTPQATWQRLGSMLILAICYGFAETLLLLLIGWQVIALLTGQQLHTAHVRALGGALSRYIYHIFLYLTCNSNQRPFPFAAWLNHSTPPA